MAIYSFNDDDIICNMGNPSSMGIQSHPSDPYISRFPYVLGIQQKKRNKT